MTNEDLIKLLQAGKVDEFNRFRANNLDFKINLSGADLAYADLAYTDLSDAYLCGAIFRGAIFRGAIFRGAKFREAILESADLRGAFLKGAFLWTADLAGAIFDKNQIAMLPELLGIKVIEDKNE